MRHLLFRSLAALACFGVFSLVQTSAAPKPDQLDKPDFNGTWTLDLKASASLEPIMKKVGASLLEQIFASGTNLKATIHQSEQVITVATRGRGFALDETLYPDGRSHPSNLQLLGANCLTPTLRHLGIALSLPSQYIEHVRQRVPPCSRGAIA